MTQVPFADVDWLLNRVSGAHWLFIGCVGPEKRSISCLSRVNGRLNSRHLLRIFDQKIPSGLELNILDQRKSEAIELGVPSENISDQFLFATNDHISAFCKNSISHGGNVILDITSLPKRWFFFLLRELLTKFNLKNLIITYSSASGYAADLSFDPEFARALPGFQLLTPRSNSDIAFVGVGYHAAGLRSVLEQQTPKQIQMFFPFPPGLPGMMRNWDSVRNLEQISREILIDQFSVSGERLTYLQLHAHDVGLCFEAMVKLTDSGKKTSMGAPYGPKPLSLAMCLFALACEAAGLPEVPLYYTQPTRYSFEYSTDVKLVNGIAEVTAFPVVLAGRNQYVIG